MHQYDIEKVANAIVFFIDSGIENLGKTKLMKLMFFSDKYHLEKYTRSIFHDTYFKLPFGPVPSLTLNTIDSINEFERDDFEDHVKAFLSTVIVSEQYDGELRKTIFSKKKEFDKSYFSKSELEILKKVCDEFRSFTARQISDYSHELAEYKETDMNDIISSEKMSSKHVDYLKFIKSENKEFDRMLNS